MRPLRLVRKVVWMLAFMVCSALGACIGIALHMRDFVRYHWREAEAYIAEGERL